MESIIGEIVKSLFYCDCACEERFEFFDLVGSAILIVFTIMISTYYAL